MKSRDCSIDMMRGIAIILVVFGHVIQSVYAPDSYDDNWIFKVIYSFHMPLFMFISGYLSGYKKELTFRWLWGRAVRLVVPFVVWIPIDFLIDGGRTINDFINVLIRIYRDPSDGGLWFLWVLFLCCIVLFVVENINARIYRMFFANRIRFSGIKEYIIEFSAVIVELMILGALWAVTNFTTAFGLWLCCKEIIFFLAGFYFCKYCHMKEGNKALHDKRWKKLFYFAFPGMVIFWDRTHFVTFHDILNRWAECNGILRLIIIALEVAYYYSVSFVGIGFVWNLVKRIENTNFRNKLAYIGNYTIEVYILHTYFFVHSFDNIVTNAILSLLLGVMIPLLIGKLINGEKHLRFILFGK